MVSFGLSFSVSQFSFLLLDLFSHNLFSVVAARSL